MPVEPNKETFLHHQPLDSRPTVVRPRLSRGWDDDFYPDRIAKESEPATVVLCDGFGIRCISGSRAALRAFDFGMAISDTLDRTYVLDRGLRRLRRKRNVFRDGPKPLAPWSLARPNRHLNIN